MMFISPTKGKLELEEMVADIIDYMGEDSRFRYCLIIGTDSQVAKGVDFVNAVVIHRVGKGGRYFWRRVHREYSTRLTLKARIFTEANLSIELAVELLQFLQRRLADAFLELIPQIEVHIDVGQNGPTREMIKELVGLVRANGFEARIKPEAYAASTVADKYA
ncbi:MAG: ribonuclease H-like YkuK family protein [Candidatus Portnoybacteria bacterium]|nr:ribonuclease H-like YkuK family protein [Candidatus Portnoybacteria bacterium]